jgi:hypothetical protein
MHHDQIKPADHGNHTRVNPQNGSPAWGAPRRRPVHSRQAEPSEARGRGDVCGHRRAVREICIAEDATYKESQLSGARMGQAVKLKPVRPTASMRGATKKETTF